MNHTLFYTLALIWLALAMCILPVLLFVHAPYGRYTKKGWGPLIPNNLGWILMELPSLVVFSASFLGSKQPHDIKTWTLFSLWCVHYVNRSVVYPFRIRTGGKKMPLLILLMAVCFNSVNGYLNGFYLGRLRPVFPVEGWFLNVGFIVGLLLFIAGLTMNTWSDNQLIKLRKNRNGGYHIPYGGLFTWVSCPNYLGEIIEWGGFAMMAWNIPALSFLIWTMANLLPRALDHHRWYRRQFPDYPSKRKALLPGIL